MNKNSQQQQIKVMEFFNWSCKYGLLSIIIIQIIKIWIIDVERHLGKGALYNMIIYDMDQYELKYLSKNHLTIKTCNSYHN